MSPEARLGKALTRVPEGKQTSVLPGAGSFAKQGRGPDVVIHGVKRMESPGTAPDGSGFPSAPPGAFRAQPAPSCGSCRTWLPRAQLHTLHRGCFSHRALHAANSLPELEPRLFLPPHCSRCSPLGAAAVKESLGGTHDTQQGPVPHPQLPVPALTVLGTTVASKGTEGWALLECNSSLCRRPGHLLFSGATRVMKWYVNRIFSVYRYRLFIF